VTHITLPRSVLFVALVLLALFPLVSTTFYIQLGAKIIIMAIFALSLDLLVGHTGLVSFGHAAYFGVAAYALALIAPKYEAANHWLTLPAALIVTAIAALVIGFLVVRTAGIYFIMVTLRDFSRHQTRRWLGRHLHYRPARDDPRRFQTARS
jgi:branched-chain amino acid transport system permease protein